MQLYRFDRSENGCRGAKGGVVGAGAKDFGGAGRTISGASGVTNTALPGASDVREGVVGEVGPHGMPDPEAFVVG